MKRRRREERREGINDRIRARAAESTEVTVHDAEPFDPDAFRDRMRYGDCGGFGAPQARAMREQQGWRSTA